MIKKLAKSIRQYKKASILSPVFMAFEVTMEVLIPFLMANLIDLGITGGNMDYIVKMSIVLFLAALLSLGFGIMSGIFAATASAGFAGNLRHDMYRNVQNFSFSNIDKFSTASLVTRLTTDVTNLQNAYQMIIRQAVRAPLMIILALSMSFRVNAKISLIFLGAIPVLGLGLFFIHSSVHPIFTRAFKRYDKLNSVVQENLHGIRVVKSYVREEMEKEKFEAISNDIYTDFTKAQKRVAFNAPLIQLCVNACMILIAWIGAKLIVGGTMSTGELMSIIAYTMQILMSLNLLSMVFVMIIISRVSAERIVQVLEEESDLKNPEHPVMAVKDGGIVFKNVSFSYRNDESRPCLCGVDLEISSGETIGIIGGTGSSKTSFVQLIPRLYDVTTGAVLIGGVDVRNYDIEALRSEVAVVLQKNLLFSGSIKDNLRWGDADADDEEIRRVSRLAQADDFVISFIDGYDTYIEQGGTNVSGGQKQRLCIARALLKKPKILILDDSTSAVDTKTDSLIRKALKEEIPNTTKLIIAQRISSIQDADRIIVMDGGLINAVGTHDELLSSNQIYKEVYNSQIQGGGDFDAEK
ncbi:ABC transporter ATP-binding protein [Lacrimispora sp.]|uniref:ABC transporter ATP-binding protein n=1 Tax=Lacrimispora sp. TaxID=2719234 RepID=UPI0028B137D5|nr:ABC transporter ATP-binding protein [Lacrimispora sp.]